MVNIEKIKQLKRENKLADAASLLEKMVIDTENQASKDNSSVNPWPYEQLSIIYRKEKRIGDEIKILEQFVKQPHSGSTLDRKLFNRLKRAYELNEKKSTTSNNMASLTMNGLVVDVETTGFSHQDDLVEIGAILFEFNTLSGQIIRNIDEYNGLQEPKINVPTTATKVHGITPDQLKGKTINREKVDQLFKKADIILAHNANFDRKFIIKMFQSTKMARWHCTMNGINWKGRGFENKKLQHLLSAHKISPGTAHRAIDDAKATLELLTKQDSKTDYPYLFEVFLSRPLSPPQKNRQTSRNRKFKSEDYELMMNMSPKKFQNEQEKQVSIGKIVLYAIIAIIILKYLIF